MFMQFVPISHPIAGIHYVYKGANYFIAQYHEALNQVMAAAPQATSSKALFRSPAYVSFKSEVDQHYLAFRTMVDLSREDVSHAFRLGGVPMPVTPSQHAAAGERLGTLWREQVDRAYHDTVDEKVAAIHDQWVTAPAGEAVFSSLGDRIDQVKQALMADMAAIEHQDHKSPKALLSVLRDAGNAMQGEIITALQTAEKSLVDSVTPRPPMDAVNGYMAELVPMLPDPSVVARLLQWTDPARTLSQLERVHETESLPGPDHADGGGSPTDWNTLT